MRLADVRLFMQIFEIIPGKLFQSGQIDDWSKIESLGVALVLDLSDIDPNIPNDLIYWHCPIVDGPLPDAVHLSAMDAMAVEASWFLSPGNQKVLAHCGAGVNRASLMNGMIIHYFDPKIPGQGIVDLIRAGRPGALGNQNFVNYLLGLK